MDRSALVIALALTTLVLVMIWGWLSKRDAKSGLSRARLDGPKAGDAPREAKAPDGRD